MLFLIKSLNSTSSELMTTWWFGNTRLYPWHFALCHRVKAIDWSFISTSLSSILLNSFFRQLSFIKTKMVRFLPFPHRLLENLAFFIHTSIVFIYFFKTIKHQYQQCARLTKPQSSPPLPRTPHTNSNSYEIPIVVENMVNLFRLCSVGRKTTQSNNSICFFLFVFFEFKSI